MCNRDIEKSICREMSGDLEKGMLAVGTCHMCKAGLLIHLKMDDEALASGKLLDLNLAC